MEKTTAQPSVQLFDATTIDALHWPDTEEGIVAKKILVPLIKQGVHHYFDNINTTLLIAKIDHQILPITVNGEEYENSYVCSPYGTYFGFAKEYIPKLKSVHLQRLAKGGIFCLEQLCRRGKINQVVIVNNWLFATNLYPDLSKEQIQALTTALKKIFPHHTLLFRSIPSLEYSPSFLPHDYELIPCRPIYVLDGRKEEVFRCRMFKSDLKVLEKTDYVIVGNHEIHAEELPRLIELYRILYIQKYSKQSPQINERFMELALKHGLFHIKALKKEGKIDAVVGYFQRNGWITSPLFGYDTTSPDGLALYRMISTLVSLEAKKTKAVLHQSSGASSYKQLRRAKANIEYIAIYMAHLPWHRKAPWKLLKWIMTRFGLPVIKRLDV